MPLPPIDPLTKQAVALVLPEISRGGGAGLPDNEKAVDPMAFPVPKPPGKILLVRFSAFGDVIQTLPVLTMLREGFPDAKIGWAIDTELAPAIEGHPALDYIHRCSRNGWKRGASRPFQWPSITREFTALVGEVKSVGYEVSIDAQGLFKTALLPFLAGIRRRIGYKHGREFSSLFYTEQYQNSSEYFDPAVFHLEHMAGLVRMLGAAETNYKVEPPVVSEAPKQRAREVLKHAFAEPAPIVAMAPATQWESKSWPEENWISLLQQLLARTNLNVLLMGSSADGPLAERILSALHPEQLSGRVCNLFGKAPIRDMYALYGQVEAAVGPDSAPLHVAGAAGVPVLIGIYGPTGYRRTPPLGSPHMKLLSTEGQLSCQPCHQRRCPLGTDECMKRISPDDVFHSLLEALTEAGIEFTRHGAVVESV
jgi:lipopolysaccharide heptosyltransferase II